MAKFDIKYIFLSHGIICFIFGIGFLIIPTPMTALIGFTLGDDGLTAVRICGISIFCIGAIAFSFRKEPHSTLRQNIILVYILLYTTMTILNILFFDLTIFMVWFLIILHAFYAVIYAYFYIKNRGK